MSNPPFIRIDRNYVVFAPDIAQIVSKSDLGLFEAAFVAINYAFMYPGCFPENLFGYKEITPLAFARLMNYSKNYLVTKHPNPVAAADGQPQWASNLDNAFYQLFYKQVRFSRAGKTPVGDDTEKLEELRVFEHFKRYTTEGKQPRVVYEYKEHPTLVNNLARYFFYFDFELYRELSPAERFAYKKLIWWRTLAEYNEKRFDYQPLQFIQPTHREIMRDFYLATSQKLNKQKLAVKDLIFKINQKTYEVRKRADPNAIIKPDTVHYFDIDYPAGTKEFDRPILYFYYPDHEIEFRKTDFERRFFGILLFNLKESLRQHAQSADRKFLSVAEFDYFLKDQILKNDAFLVKEIRRTFLQVRGKELPETDLKSYVNRSRSVLPARMTSLMSRSRS